MTDYSGIIFPQNTPVTGKANYVAQPVAPVTAVANRTPVLNPVVPVTAVTSSSGLQVTTQQTARAQKNPDPYNTSAPAIGVPNIIPFPTPLGVSPQFTTPTENWTWDYGDSMGI
jgi:hypothetical protein